MRLRTVQEWRPLPFGAGETEIPEPDAIRLAAVARSLAPSLAGEDGSRILTLGRSALHVRQMVGVLTVGDCALEILPKIDGLDDGGVRRQLIHMLAAALDLDIAAGATASLSVQNETLLDILIRLFAEGVVAALRRGMPRTYLSDEEDLPSLRGRLNAQRQFTVLAATPQRLACRYDELSPNIALNQIIKAAINKLLWMARVPETRRLLRELSFAYAQVSTVPVSGQPWQRVVLDRTNKSWRTLLNLARLLLGNQFQTTTSGTTQGVALLFDMAALFEGFVARHLSRSLVPLGFEVIAQGGRLFCLEDPATGRGLFQTKPDILIKRGGRVELVIDTKWKQLSRRVDDLKQGVNQADIYQMIAYGRLYRSKRLMLLYPHHCALGTTEGVQTWHRLAGNVTEEDRITPDDRLFTASVDLTRLADMPGRLASLVVRAVQEAAAV